MRALAVTLLVLTAGACSSLRSDPPDAGGACPPGLFQCGTTCHACCTSADCPVVMGATGTCGQDRTCSYLCRAENERCRGSCMPSSKMIGVCLAVAGTVPTELYWCDTDDLAPTLLKFKFSVRQAMELGYDIGDPDLLDKVCLGASNALLGTYCSSGRFATGRVERMDTVFIYSGTLDADGKLAQYKRTPGSGSRTCRPP